MKAFWDEMRDQIYIFYRQGQSFSIDLRSKELIHKEVPLTDYDIGTMMLYQNRLLIVQSSTEILFFEFTGTSAGQASWKKYFELEIQGFVFEKPQSS